MGPRYDGAWVATLSGIWDRVRDRGLSLDLDELDRLEGRTCLVTGANRGLGLAVAAELARRGGRLVLACRSGTAAAIEHVREGAARRATVEGLSIDLGDLASVERAVETLEGAGIKLDVLVLNAGIVPARARSTRDGFDESFQVNVLSNVLFVRRAWERGLFARGAPHRPRIVVVSSESHRTAPAVDWSALGEYRAWGMREAVEQYGYAKLLLQTFTAELERRIGEAASVHSLCPGAVRTDIGREAPGWAKPALDWTMRAFFKDPREGAEPVVYLAAARAIEGRTGIYLHVKRSRPPSAAATDPIAGARIWSETERLLAARGHALRPLDARSAEGGEA